MSLFFYGAVGAGSDAETTAAQIDLIGEMQGWTLTVETVSDAARDNLNLSQPEAASFIYFELVPNADVDTFALLYDHYDGQKRVDYYRAVAREYDVLNADTLGFGTSETVDQYYKTTPLELPMLTFMTFMLSTFHERKVIFCIDAALENHLPARDLVGDAFSLIVEAWQTIAFGFTDPHLRLLYLPESN